LPSVASSVELLQVNLIRQLIRHSRQDLSNPPKWFIPAQYSIDFAFNGQGSGLNFSVYSAVTVGPNISLASRSCVLEGRFCYLEHESIVKLQCSNPVLTKLTWPLWTNVFLRFTKEKRTLGVLHRKVYNFLSHQGITRISTFCCIFGWTPDKATLRFLLAGSSMQGTRSLASVVQKLAPRLAVPLH